MVKGLGIEIHPLLDDPFPRNRFARWEPWPPESRNISSWNASTSLLTRPSPACRHPDRPAADARQANLRRHPDAIDLSVFCLTNAIRIL
jgi:hypothetical protein